jgi:ABC-2 type transport system permease protein
MLSDIVRFEWRYHTRQVSFAAAAALFFLFGFTLTSTGFGPDNINVNSPYSIAQSIGLLSLFAVFILAAFCANAVVRDRETQMEEIVYTTSVDKLPFLLGRFTGSFLAAFTAFSTCALGMLVARFMPWQDADRLGVVHLGHYIWALLVIALPNLFFAAVVLFALSTVTRSVLASYVGSVLIYVLYFVSAALTNSPLMAASVPGANEGASLAALLDPFALSAFFEQTQHWTPAIRNTQLLALSGNFLLNRALWIAISLVILAIVYRLFSFRTTSRKAPRSQKVIDSDNEPLTPYAPIAAEPSQWSAYLAATKIEIRTFLLTLPFLAMSLLWAALAVFELVSDINGGEYGAASYPASGMLFATIHQPLTLLATILLIYTSAEMVWRERSLRMSGILNATPTSNAVFVASKCTALAALIGALTATALLAIALLQLTKGWTPEPLLLLKFSYFVGAPLLLFSCLAVVIQTLSPHKYLGMLIVLLVAVLGQSGDVIGLHHPLWRFASAPDLPYSDMNGFGRTSDFHWLMLYWGAFTGLMLLIATASWRHAYVRRNHRAIAAFALIFLGSGVFIFYNQTEPNVLQWKANYEKSYRNRSALPQPRIESIHAQIDLFPNEHRYRVRGNYVLVNKSAEPIADVLVTTELDTKVIKLALPPHGKATLPFDVTYEDQTSYIARAFPTIGYRPAYEIEDARDRRRYGLPPKATSTNDELPNVVDWVQFDVTISTPSDQRVVAPGRLIREWQHGGRRSFQYRSDAPMPNQFIFSSAHYAVTREMHDGIAIEINHHPKHTQNVTRMMRAAAESLHQYNANFGPYPYSTLRLAEVPAQLRNFSGFAEPGVIFLGENRGFLIDARDPNRLDLVYRRVAHEVAHQWWGYTLVPADAPGAALLTESLTKYSELLALEKAYGREQVRQSLTYELDLYLSGRTSESGAEPPLLRVDDQSYLYYRKGALVLYALKDLLGENAANAAFRNLLREKGGPDGRPTSADLLRHLHAIAPPAQHALINEWLTDVVLYDLSMNSARARRLASGKYEVTMHVMAAKHRANEQILPLRESIDIGLFSADDKTLYLKKHALRGGAQNITVVVDKEPLFAAVDPYLCRIDRNRFDNSRRVER